MKDENVYLALDKEIDSAARELVCALRERGMTFGAAESCTAGLICARLGDISGVSDVLRGGVVSYANGVKTDVLGVPEDVLKTFGAVSEECARHMAEGARRVLGVDIAVSVTGIAGPGGGTDEKPVGTVCFGVAAGGTVHTTTAHFSPRKDRGTIRRRAVIFALRLSRDMI